MNPPQPVDYSGVPDQFVVMSGMVRQHMRENGRTQADLSLITGLSKPYISQLIHCRRFGTPNSWDKLMFAARCSFGEALAMALANQRVAQKLSV